MGTTSGGAFGAIGTAMRDIREAEADLRKEQDAAWRRYAERVDAILAADLPFDRHPDDDDHSATHVLDAVRARLDELRLQTHLGAMEGEELVQRVRTALRRLAA